MRYDAAGRPTVVATLPGYLRDLAFAGGCALIGLCQIRERHVFGGLPVRERFPQLLCGVAVVELATGRPLGLFEFTSLTAAGGKLLVLSECGELMAAPATPERFRPTARAKVLTGKCWTVPVLRDGRVYCRNADGDLVCLGLRAPVN